MDMNRSRLRAFAARLHFCAAIFGSVYCAAAAAADTSKAVTEAGRELAPVVGTWITQEAFLGVRWITLLVSAIVLVAVILADVLLRRVILRKARDEQARAEGGPSEERARHRWLERGLRASIPPLTLLVWVAGVYAAIALVVRDLELHDTVQAVLRVLDFAVSAGLLAGLFWLVYRVTRVIEHRGRTVSESAESLWDRVVFPHAAKAVRRALPLVVLIIGVP